MLEVAAAIHGQLDRQVTMDRLTSTAVICPWQLAGFDAVLHADRLRAKVDLLQPASGLHDLSWHEASLVGNILGVTVSAESNSGTNPATVDMDKFVRCSDLVANYPQCETQPFTLHVYWRIATADSRLIILDAIVSLQTSLLECFPKAILATQFAANEAWLVPGDGSPPSRLGKKLESTAHAGVLVRPTQANMSYLEITHPDDLGEWRVSNSATTKMERKLGGEFQEKGVIRRLRVRGAFLAAENDLEVAAQIIQDFAALPPPLTA